MSFDPSQLEREAAEDVNSVLLSDFGFASAYRGNAGQAAEAPVLVALSSAHQQARKFAGGRFGGEAANLPAERWAITVAAIAPGEAVSANPAVGVNGGVVELKEGDTFKVPPRRLGKPAGADVLVIVRGNVDLPAGAGHWTAEVTR